MKSLKTALLIAILALVGNTALAQHVRETNIKKGKEHIPGYTVKLHHSKSQAREVICAQMADAGYTKAKHKKGFAIYKGILLHNISPTKADYYIKVKGNKRKAHIYFIASKGYDNYVTRENDAAMAGKIDDYLESLVDKIDAQAKIEQKEKQKQQLEKDIKKLGAEQK